MQSCLTNDRNLGWFRKIKFNRIPSVIRKKRALALTHNELPSPNMHLSYGRLRMAKPLLDHDYGVADEIEVTCWPIVGVPALREVPNEDLGRAVVSDDMRDQAAVSVHEHDLETVYLRGRVRTRPS